MTQRSAPLYTLFGRVFWMMIGPALLLIATYLIVTAAGGWLTAIDVAFFLVLVGMIVARWVEFGSHQAETVYGTPATARDVRRYAILVAVGGVAVWTIANLLGNHVL